MDKTTKEILTEARSLITDPDNWTQGSYAKDAEGVAVSIWSNKATCWCALGALYSFNEDALLDIPADTLNTLRPHILSQGIVTFNDNHTHEEVLAAFDKAIEGCKEE